MRFAALAISPSFLTGCAPQQELRNRTPAFTQAELDHDYQECSNLSAAVPDVHNQTDIYTSHVTTIGNQTTVTTGPAPYAQLGQYIRDSMESDERRTAVRRYCMNCKGYNFVGMRDAPRQ